VVDVRVHGPLRDDEPRGDVPVGQPARDEHGDLPLAGGEAFAAVPAADLVGPGMGPLGQHVVAGEGRRGDLRERPGGAGRVQLGVPGGTERARGLGRGPPVVVLKHGAAAEPAAA